MTAQADRFDDRLHAVVAVLSLWLVITSPWLAMVRRIPSGAGWLDYAHVVLGWVALPVGAAYAFACTRGGRWRLNFPVGRVPLGSVGRDLAGIVRGRVPAAEGGGLFGLIEGLALAALLATAAAGAAWFFAQGSSDALAWRACHVGAARVLVGLLVLHVFTVSLHLLDFVRD